MTGDFINLTSAFGEIKTILLARVMIESKYSKGCQKVGMVENLPIECLIGNDSKRNKLAVNRIGLPAISEETEEQINLKMESTEHQEKIDNWQKIPLGEWVGDKHFPQCNNLIQNS